MADTIVDATVVENLIGELLIEGPDKVEPDIRVYYPHESPPAPDADDGSDTPIARWCRINPVQLPDSMARRSAASDCDQQPFVVMVTCGVSSAQMRTEPARLNQVAHLVAAALRGAHAQHALTTHHIQVTHASRETRPGGIHELTQIAVVGVRGLAQRVSGSSASLNT